MTQCNGTCCEMLMLYYSPDELAEASHNDAESAQIAEMLTPIGPGRAPDGTAGWLYSCKNWDTKTRLCKIYDQRPMMCRDYPYNGQRCDLCGLVQ